MIFALGVAARTHASAEATPGRHLSSGALTELPALLQVPRRVKVLPPDSRFFSVQRVLHEGQEDGSTVASGMEVVFEGAGDPAVNGPMMH